MIASAANYLLLFALSFAPALADDSQSPTPTGNAKKVLGEYIKKERAKRWAFEDRMIQQQRSFEDESRKQKRDAELEDEAILESTPDLATRKLVQDKRRERQKQWQVLRAEHQKLIQKQKKEFHQSLAADRKILTESRGHLKK